jgi:hypothetical protein
MLNNLIQIKTFLGKYYSELLYSAAQEKYQDTELDHFFEQRFTVQGNKAQMIIDPSMPGLSVVVNGNEIYVSKTLYDHTNIVISNSMENSDRVGNPRSRYSPETFSTIAYLICQNQTTFEIVGDIDEPIYVKYKTEYESFYNSILHFDINDGVDVEIVEEIESHCALNSVENYLVRHGARLNLSTFYKNNLSAISFVYRDVSLLDQAQYNHSVFGKGSSNVIDENRLITHEAQSELVGIRDSNGKNFHSILYVEPKTENFKANVLYKDIIYNKSNISFFPMIVGQLSDNATIDVDSITCDNLEDYKPQVKEFIQDIVNTTTVERTLNCQRFYNNKTDFLKFL